MLVLKPYRNFFPAFRIRVLLSQFVLLSKAPCHICIEVPVPSLPGLSLGDRAASLFRQIHSVPTAAWLDTHNTPQVFYSYFLILFGHFSYRYCNSVGIVLCVHGSLYHCTYLQYSIKKKRRYHNDCNIFNFVLIKHYIHILE